MKNQPFNFILRLILDEFDIENDYIASCLDRCPSRIRHWKSDSYPSKKLLSPLIGEINSYIVSNASEIQKATFKTTLIATLKTQDKELADIIEMHTYSNDDIPNIVEYTLRSLYKKPKKAQQHA